MADDHSNEPRVDSAELLKYVVSECSHFFSNLVYTIEASVARGEVPQTNKQPGKKPRSATKDKSGVKRKPNSFNIYMQKKCEQLKAGGAGSAGSAGNAGGNTDQTTLFGQAAASWKALTDEQRKAYSNLYLQNPDDPELNNLPEPHGSLPSAVLSPSSLEAPKKRKKSEDAEILPAATSLLQDAVPPVSSEGKKKKKKKKDKEKERGRE